MESVVLMFCERVVGLRYCSYGINMLHFRVMLELATRYIKPARANAPDHWSAHPPS